MQSENCAATLPESRFSSISKLLPADTGDSMSNWETATPKAQGAKFRPQSPTGLPWFPTVSLKAPLERTSETHRMS